MSGKRPIDLHLYALTKLGAKVEEGAELITASCSRLQGRTIEFPKRSVGATQQAILAAVMAAGETELLNCACEPEIKWLCRYLKTMGALIRGEGSSLIHITGVKELNGGCMKVPPDRIVAGTYICAAAITRGSIILENPPDGELDAFLEVYRKMGGQYKGKSGKLVVNGKGIRYPVPFLKTEVYPGFPTDLQSVFMSAFCIADGCSILEETIFENRFQTVSELLKMEADIHVIGKRAMICGVKQLKGATVEAKELRGGAALVLAGLVADGDTYVKNDSFIKRGYENICRDLKFLGAKINEE